MIYFSNWWLPPRRIVHIAPALCSVARSRFGVFIVLILLLTACTSQATLPPVKIITPTPPTTSQVTTSPPSTPATQPKDNTVKVIHIADGDTITVLYKGTREEIRLIGIDTPEVKDPRKPIGCYAIEASNFTKSILTNATVTLEFDKELRDKYKRLLAYVWLSDGQMFNWILVKEGYATTATIKPNTRYENLFKQAQADAINHTRGLWSACKAHTQ